ncbi:MAG: hypothetical protein ACTHKO_04010, partial [Sphingopyxis terrae]
LHVGGGAVGFVNLFFGLFFCWAVGFSPCFSVRRAPEAHDLRALIAALPDLRMIAFNGNKAAAIGRRQLPVLEGVALVDLPSSSAANTVGYAAKLERWLRLRAALA